MRREIIIRFLQWMENKASWLLINTEKVTVYVSGSSSKLLSTDIATEIRGRSVAYELLPFSFREFARFRGIEPTSQSGLNNKETASVLKNAFGRYLVEGGFPGVQELDDIERAQVLQTYAQFTVARDVVERNGFSNAAFVRSLARIALASSGRDFSISKVHNSSKSGGYSPGRAAITEMLEAFEDAYLLFGLYEFSYSAQKIRLGGYKLYAVDPGLLYAMAPASNDGLTRALETAVYLELRRRRTSSRMGSIAIAKTPSGKEVDFVEGDEALRQAYRLVQVCLRLDDEATSRREVGALRDAMGQFGIDQGLIVTFDEERTIRGEWGTIDMVPAWKWFLQEGNPSSTLSQPIIAENSN